MIFALVLFMLAFIVNNRATGKTTIYEMLNAVHSGTYLVFALTGKL